MRQIDETADLQHAHQSSHRIGFGSRFENGQPRRYPTAAPRWKRIDNSSAGEGAASTVVAEHGSIAVEGVDGSAKSIWT